MGSYLNPGNEKFYQSVNSEIYVDKTGLIRYCNRVINTMQKYICVSRPRRFGKSVTAVSNSDWGEVSRALKNSRMALEAIWNREESKVAEAVEQAHYIFWEKGASAS